MPEAVFPIPELRCLRTKDAEDVAPTRTDAELFSALDVPQRLLLLSTKEPARGNRPIFLRAVAEQDWGQLSRKLYDADGWLKLPSKRRRRQEAEDEEWWVEKEGPVRVR